MDSPQTTGITFAPAGVPITYNEKGSSVSIDLVKAEDAQAFVDPETERR
jgi:hypothetical protein